MNFCIGEASAGTNSARKPAWIVSKTVSEVLIEVSGKCQSCGAEAKILLDHGKSDDNCEICGSPPFGCKRMEGLIYVVQNRHQEGVKVGLTTKSIQERLKQLSSTGVPGAFEVVAIFPSSKPKADEKKVHEKLQRYNLAKEHFQLDPIEAVLKAYRALKREPIFYNKSLENTFKLKREQARIEMQLRLSKQ